METTITQRRLKDLREAKGVSQEVASEACGMQRVTLARYENGSRKPVAESLAKLAEYYGVTVDYLMGVEAAAQSQLIKTEKNESKEKMLPSNEREPVSENHVLGRGEIATKYRQLSSKDKEIIDEMVRVLFGKASAEKGE